MNIPLSIFPKYRKQDSVRCRLVRGFTLVELIVSVAIMIIITSMIVINYRSFNSTVTLTNVSYDIALSIRNAQMYATGVRGWKGSFDISYGIYFDISGTNANADQQKYFMYADIDKNGRYSTGDAIVETYTIPGPFTLKDLCVKPSASAEVCGSGGPKSIEILFTRPSPDAKFVFAGNSPAAEQVKAIIQLTTDGSQDAITVRPTGQISVMPISTP